MLTTLANLVLSNRNKKLAKFYRMRAFERLGSQRYSRTAFHDLDRKLSRYLDFRDGVFIECGANDGMTQSNTYYLERFRGWRGLLVEPVPMLAELCRRFRPSSTVLECALGSSDDEEIELLYSDLMTIARGARSTQEEELEHAHRNAKYTSRDGNFYFKTRVHRLSSLLDDASFPRLDFLSLDVEGFELTVLAGLDLERHPIAHILIETADADAVSKALGSSYRQSDQLTHHDYLFSRIAS